MGSWWEEVGGGMNSLYLEGHVRFMHVSYLWMKIEMLNVENHYSLQASS